MAFKPWYFPENNLFRCNSSIRKVVEEAFSELSAVHQSLHAERNELSLNSLMAFRSTLIKRRFLSVI